MTHPLAHRRPAGLVLFSTHDHEWKRYPAEMHGNPVYLCSHCGDMAYDPHWDLTDRKAGA